VLFGAEVGFIYRLAENSRRHTIWESSVIFGSELECQTTWAFVSPEAVVILSVMGFTEVSGKLFGYSFRR